MPEKSPTAACAVSFLVLLAASVVIWADFGAFVLSLLHAMAGG